MQAARVVRRRRGRRRDHRGVGERGSRPHHPAPCPASRTRWSVPSPRPTRAPSSWSAPAPRWSSPGQTTWLRCSCPGWAGRRSRMPSTTCCTVAPSPAGRLPVTFPQRLEHTPAFGSYPGENDEVVYGEGLLVGYRWYDTRHLPVAFPFGHGGSYTTFAWGPGSLSQQAFSPGDRLTVRLDVTNTGEPFRQRGGAGLRPSAGRAVATPAQRAQGLRQADPRAWVRRSHVEVVLQDRSFACWDPGSVAHEHLRRALGDGSVVPATQGPSPQVRPWLVRRPGTVRRRARPLGDRRGGGAAGRDHAVREGGRPRCSV